LQFDYDPKSFAANMRAMIRLYEEVNGLATSCRIDLREGGAQGNSIDLHSRRSRSYLRNYDKSREQKGAIPENCLRFEQENKRERARAVWAYFKKERASAPLAVAQVSTALKRCGAIMDWNMSIPRQNIKTERHQTTNEKRTKWLIEQVAPIVRKLPDDANKARIMHAMGFTKTQRNYKRVPKPEPALLDRILKTKGGE
jgi:DNA relaxase NicK